MPAYDVTRFDPACSTGVGDLAQSGHSTTLSDCRMLLDSGADLTLVHKRRASVRSGCYTR